MKYKIIVYADSAGKEPYTKWFFSIKEMEIRVRIQKRILRAENENLGEVKALKKGIAEMKLDFGPGYRVYYGISGNYLLLLLGGDKKTQQKDINKALEYWKDYEEKKDGKI